MTGPDTTSSISGKLIALDVGLARIGVAVCDPLQLSARPLTTVQRTTRRRDFEKLAAVIEQEEAQAIICGLPLDMEGCEGAQAKSVRKWAKRLAYALRALEVGPISIIYWDERLSTFEASELATPDELEEGDDAVAAAVILQRYLDRDTSMEHPYGEIRLPYRCEIAEEPCTESTDAKEAGPSLI